MDTSRAIPESHPLHRLFRGLTEYAFMNELGIGDPSLVGLRGRIAGELCAQPGALANPRRARSPAGSSYGDDRRSGSMPTTPLGGENAIAMSVISHCFGRASIRKPWPNCKGRAKPTRS